MDISLHLDAVQDWILKPLIWKILPENKTTTAAKVGKYFVQSRGRMAASSRQTWFCAFTRQTGYKILNLYLQLFCLIRNQEA